MIENGAGIRSRAAPPRSYPATIPKNILAILIQNQDGRDKSKDTQDDAGTIPAPPIQPECRLSNSRFLWYLPWDTGSRRPVSPAGRSHNQSPL